MRQEKKLYSVKIAEKISSSQEECVIIQYGLHQGFLIMFNVLTAIICGVLWMELPFVVLLFLGNFFLRPYAGGYHADTELRCYMISTVVINIAVWARKTITASNMALLGMWVVTTLFIWIYTPVENPVHCLDEDAREKYAKNTREILLLYGIVMLLGICTYQRFFMEVIVWVQVLVVIVMAAGLWKYKNK